MHVLHNFFEFNKHNSFLLGPIQPLSPTTKELYGGATNLNRRASNNTYKFSFTISLSM